MIEGNRCQIDSDFYSTTRTESSFGAPGPDDVIEELILILSGTQHTLLQKLQLGELSKYGLVNGLRSIGSSGVCLGGSSLLASA